MAPADMTSGLDFDQFHRGLMSTLPERAPLARPSLDGRAPFTFQLEDGRAYHFAVDGGTVTVGEGAHAEGAVLRLSEDDWRRFAVEAWTRTGLLYHGHAEYVRGSYDDLCHWEPALRALFHGRPVYDPLAIDLRDRAGERLDLHQTFRLQDDRAAMAHFLDVAGYLHLREVFTPDEVDALAAGSHRGTCPDPLINDVSDWPIVALDTQAGDCSVHVSHLLHAAPPPVGELARGQHARRTAYLCFAPPRLFEALEPMQDLVAEMASADGVTFRPEDLY